APVELAEPIEEVGPLGRRRREGDEGAEVRRRGAVVAALAVQRDEAGQRGDRARLFGQRLLVTGDGTLEIADALAQLGQLEPRRANRPDVVGWQEQEEIAAGLVGPGQIT